MPRRPAPSFSAAPLSAALPPLSEDHPAARRHAIAGSRIVLYRGALSARECRDIVAFAEAQGFAPAGLAVGGDQYRTNEAARNNTRVMVEDRAFAARLWERLAPVADPAARGLNWRLRIYRYAVGQYFRPHVDLRMDLPGGGQTRASLMVYLSDGFVGGETRFFARKPRGSSKKRNNPVTHTVRPERGAALAFDHTLLHEGAAVTEGVKYAIRSDVIY